MNKDKVLSDIQALIQDIDKCTGEYVLFLLSKEPSFEKVCYTADSMSKLLVAAHQELSFLYDYIKEVGSDGQG